MKIEKGIRSILLYNKNEKNIKFSKKDNKYKMDRKKY